MISAFGAEFSLAERAGKTVALHLPTGNYFDLDPTAAEIARLLIERGSTAAAADALAERYELPLSQAQADVEGVLSAMRDSEATRVHRGRRPTLRGTWAVFRSWSRLPVRPRLAVVRATAVVVAVEIGLRVLPVDRVSRLVGVPLSDAPRTPEARPITSDDLDDKELLRMWAARWVLTLWLYDATCLRRALVWGRALRRRSPRLHIGLVDEEGVLAHAWLTMGDLTLDGRDGAVAFALPG